MLCIEILHRPHQAQTLVGCLHHHPLLWFLLHLLLYDGDSGPQNHLFVKTLVRNLGYTYVISKAIIFVVFLSCGGISDFIVCCYWMLCRYVSCSYIFCRYVVVIVGTCSISYCIHSCNVHSCSFSIVLVFVWVIDDISRFVSEYNTFLHLTCSCCSLGMGSCSMWCICVHFLLDWEQ